MKKHSLIKLNSNIKSLLFKLAGEKYHHIVLIAMTWNSIVGDLMSKRSTILKIEHNILFVKIVDHVWKQEFINLKPMILKELREKTKLDIQNILFLS